MNKTGYDIIIRPLVTERSMENAEKKIYAFETAKSANKIEIKNAVEQLFGVDVESVNTMNYMGKIKRMGVHKGRRRAWKKAVVRLKESSKTIEFFEGMV